MHFVIKLEKRKLKKKILKATLSGKHYATHLCEFSEDCSWIMFEGEQKSNYETESLTLTIFHSLLKITEKRMVDGRISRLIWSESKVIEFKFKI